MWDKKDLYGQTLQTGDVCVRVIRDSKNFNKMEYVVYKGRSWGGAKSKGEFGRFITPDGVRSLKYTSVIFAFDPLSKRRPDTQIVNELVRKFYEEKKK